MEASDILHNVFKFSKFSRSGWSRSAGFYSCGCRHCKRYVLLVTAAMQTTEAAAVRGKEWAGRKSNKDGWSDVQERETGNVQVVRQD